MACSTSPSNFGFPTSLDVARMSTWAVRPSSSSVHSCASRGPSVMTRIVLHSFFRA
ncbi:hypothetical protein BDV06DRAFT_200569 [Aspergillus oleicola]